MKNLINWFKNLFKKKEVKSIFLIPPIKETTFHTYKAEINVILTDGSVIKKKYVTTVTSDVTDCPIGNYVDNIFKQGYFRWAHGGDIRSINSTGIREISYNPEIETHTVREEFKC